MTYIVNLSTLIDYSIEETIDEFRKIYDMDNDNSCLPNDLLSLFNYAWVYIQYLMQSEELIVPYKLGKVDTETFLSNLSELFPGLNNFDDVSRKSLLVQAWNASIKMPNHKQSRFGTLVDIARNESVYLISNTNELNVLAIFELLQNHNLELKLANFELLKQGKSVDPIEIYPNVFLCLSYQLGKFKNSDTTPGIIEVLANGFLKDEPKTLISQFSGDLKKAQELGMDSRDADSFYDNPVELYIKLD